VQERSNMVMVLNSLPHIHSPPNPIHTSTNTATSSSNTTQKSLLTRRRTLVFGPTVLVAVASFLNFNNNPTSSLPSFQLALAQQQQQQDQLEQEEDRVVRLFQVRYIYFPYSTHDLIGNKIKHFRE
jgi:hypothetical protein